MLNRRVSLRGLLAAFLALMVQLAVGATVPKAMVLGATSPLAAGQLAAVEAAPICHADDSRGGAPSSPHPPDCIVCPLCAAVHAPFTVLPVVSIALATPAPASTMREGLPPPATAPPSFNWRSSQPRAPPAIS